LILLMLSLLFFSRFSLFIDSYFIFAIFTPLIFSLDIRRMMPRRRHFQLSPHFSIVWPARLMPDRPQQLTR